MKALLFFLLIFISVITRSQTVAHIDSVLYINKYDKTILFNDIDLNFQDQLSESRKARTEKYKVIAFYTASIVLNAIGDGLNDSNRKIPGHICNALSIGTLLVTPAIFNYKKDKWWAYVLSYTTLRIALFDPIYSKTRNLPLNYLDNNSSVTDRTWNYFGGQTMFPRAVSLSFGIFIPINELK